MAFVIHYSNWLGSSNTNWDKGLGSSWGPGLGPGFGKQKYSSELYTQLLNSALIVTERYKNLSIGTEFS